MRLYVGNTDARWYEYLASIQRTSEANFWRPGGGLQHFGAIRQGELFFFRLTSPISKIAGFGTFRHHSRLPLSMAWDTFGEGNGCADLASLVGLIAKYRSDGSDRRGALAWTIGCTILSDLHFYPRSEWLEFPFAPGIVQGKAIELASADGARIWSHMQEVVGNGLTRPEPAADQPFQVVTGESPVYSSALVKARQGQGAFRIMVLDAYNRRCCVTGERTLPVIDAAHIQPYVSPASNDVRNGLALREDIHTLFDSGYVAVDEDKHFIVSPRLREDFENGRDYYQLHGRSIAMPTSQQLAPSREAIRWHLDNTFLP